MYALSIFNNSQQIVTMRMAGGYLGVKAAK